MAFWTDVFLNKVRQDWLKRIVKIQYYAGGVWYDAMITNKTIEGDTLKITSQTTDSKALVVTSVRLIDTGGDVAGQISRNLIRRVLSPFGSFHSTRLPAHSKEVKNRCIAIYSGSTMQ